MSYVTLQEFKVHLRTELGGVDDDELQECLDSADASINDYCGRTFSVAGNSATRVYAPLGGPVLFIDDATTVTAVTVDGTALASTYWQKEPLNGYVNGQVRPYTRLVRLGSVWPRPSDGEAVVSVTGTFGWAAVPSRVTSTAKILAKEIAETRNQLGGYQVIAPEVAARAISHPKYRQLLDPLRRMDRVGGFA